MTSTQPKPESLAAQTVTGSVYSIAASAVTMVLGFGRSVLMARLLAPEDFGVVAFALTFLNFTAPFRDFGLDQALIHRKRDEKLSLDDALAVHFSLRLILIVLFVLLLLAAIPILRYVYPQKTMLAPILLALTVGSVAGALGATPTTYLRKEMRFRELAVLQLLTSLSMTIVGPLMAWQGYGVWAIVGERISGIIVATVVVWAFIHPWQLRWRFEWETAKWYLNYGKFLLVSKILAPVLNQFDDYWVGATAGATALGFYSKAYEFAQYPRRVISDPIINVVFSTFSELQDNRLALSKAYYRTASLIIRLGFLAGGMLIWGGREFIMLLIGNQWLPMVTTFQLMVVYALLDPLRSVSANLILATGQPRSWTVARVVESIFFVPAVIIASSIAGAKGVAIVVDIAVILALSILFYSLRDLVDISFLRLLLPPSLAIVLSFSLGWAVLRISFIDTTIWRLIMKIGFFAATYNGFLIIFEGREYHRHLERVWNILKTQQLSGIANRR
jgi:O-antigen/teichoic acid export membrane protein